MNVKKWVVALAVLLSVAAVHAVDLPPVVSISASNSTVESTVIISVIGIDLGDNKGIDWMRLFEDGSEIDFRDCSSQMSCSLVSAVSHTSFQSRAYTAKIKDVNNNEAVSDSVQVNFTGPDTPPVWDSPLAFIVQEDSGFTGNVTDVWQHVQDAQWNDSMLAITIINQSNATLVSCVLNGSRYIDCATNASNATGSSDVIMQARDARFAINATIEVRVSGVNDPPVFFQIPNQSMLEDNGTAFLNISPFVFDIDSSLNLSAAPRNSSSAACGIVNQTILSFTPLPDFFGMFNCTITASDFAFNISEDVEVEVFAVNDPPVAVDLNVVFSEDFNFSINLSENVTDVDDALNSLVWTLQAAPANATISIVGDNLTVIPDLDFNGVNNATLRVEDSGLLGVNITLFIDVAAVNDPPVLAALPPQSVLEDNGTIAFDISPFVFDTENDSVTFAIIAQNVSAVACTITGTNLTMSPLANFSGSANCTVEASDGFNATNQTVGITVIPVNDRPELNVVDQVVEAGSLLNYTVGFSDVDGDLLSLSDNATEFSITSLGEIVFTPATFGVFVYDIMVCDDSGAANNCTSKNLTITVTDSQAPQFVNISVPANRTFALNAMDEFNATVLDNDGIGQVQLEIDGQAFNVTSGGSLFVSASTVVSGLSGGTHSFKWLAADAAGNIASSALDSFTISPAATSVDILANGSVTGITIPQGSTILVQGVSTGPENHSVDLQVDSASVTSGITPVEANVTFSTLGVHNVSVVFAGDQNYTAANDSLTVTVIDVIPPSVADSSVFLLTFDPFQQQVLTANVSDSGSSIDSVLAEIDGVNLTASLSGSNYVVSVGPLAAGTHNLTWFVNDSSGNQNSTFVSWSVAKAAPALKLMVNGIEGNVTALVNATVTVIANITLPDNGVIQLFDNGSSIGSSNGDITFATSYSGNTTRNYTVSFAGDQNYTAAILSRFAEITDTFIVTKSNITPAVGSINITPDLSLSFNTGMSIGCRWALTDLPYSAMTNDFTQGTLHSAKITGLSLSARIVYVVCENETAAGNTELNYDVRNIFDNAVISGSSSDLSIINSSSLVDTADVTGSNVTSSTINNSDVDGSNLVDAADVTGSNVTSSIISNSNIMTSSVNTSTVNNSILTNCVVSNSFVKNIIASNCFFIDSLVDPPSGSNNLSGSVITGNSSIFNSNVTNSNIDGSTIINSSLDRSNINNSNITTSMITNVSGSNNVVTGTTLSSTVINDAIIISNIVQNGTIQLPDGSVYNATQNGSVNTSDIINSAPVTSASVSGTSITEGGSVTFTGVFSDVNIGSLLNDSVSVLWVFDDGTNSTDIVTSKTYGSAGTFQATFTATDSFGLSSSQSFSITVSASGSGGGSSSGGSSGGGGGGGGGGRRRETKIEVSDQPVEVNFRLKDRIAFDWQGAEQTIFISKMDRKDKSVSIILDPVGRTGLLEEGIPVSVHLNNDERFDLQLTFVRFTNFGMGRMKLQLINAVDPKRQAAIAPPEPVIVESEDFLGPQEESIDQEVPVEVEVKASAFSRLKNAITGMFSFDISSGLKHHIIGIIIMVGIVLVGLGVFSMFRPPINI